ncbi:MAG: L-threonylcarbamoyladenylate synthase [Promethearchaeota archaeon]
MSYSEGIISITDNYIFSNKQIEKIHAIISSDGVIVFPTETCYGIGVNALSDKAVEKVYKIKQRTPELSISVALTKNMLWQYAQETTLARKLVDKFLPGPLTMILIQKGNISQKLNILSPKRIGFRVPAFSPILSLIDRLQVPLTATSANISGKTLTYSIKEVQDQIPRDRFDLIIDGGTIPPGPPSTVIDLTAEKPQILREGALSSSLLKKYLRN